MYSMILSFSILLGYTIGYFISNILQQRIITNSTNIQYDLLSFTDSSQSFINPSDTLTNMSLRTFLMILLKVVVISFGEITICITLLMLIILKGNIKDKLQKGE